MYSTKNIENVLLSELTRKQYDTFMKDVKNSPKLSDYSEDLSYKKIRNIRNSSTYKQIFGNKQRIWILFDDNISVSDNKHDEVLQIPEINNYIKIATSFLGSFNEYYEFNVSHLFKLIYDITYKKPDKLGTIFDEYRKPLYLLYWIKGYMPINNQIIKIGSYITQLINQLNKLNLNDWSHSTEMRQRDRLIKILTKFNNRDSDSELPQDLYIAGKNVPDEYVFKKTIKKRDKLWICISRYPADVAAMSTGQGWTSCQDLDPDKTKVHLDYSNGYNWHTKYEVALGTCVAYLIKESAIKRSKKNQNKPTKYDDRFKGKSFIPKTSLFPLLSPTARILIKPFYGTDKNTGQECIYLSTAGCIVYGDANQYRDWVDTVSDYIEQRQSHISGMFYLPDELWNERDNDFDRVEVSDGSITAYGGERQIMSDEEGHYETDEKY